MDEILGSRGWPKDVLPRLFPGRRPWHVRSLGLFRRHEALILSDGHIRVIFRTNHRVCDWISVVRFFNSWTGHICRRIRFVSRRVLLQLVVVNLYPFKETIAKDPDFEDAIEQIDIGGPTMIRAAAKNFAVDA